MSSDTAETVKSCRELLDSGVDPMALMSQLAGVIMDIIAGIYRRPGTKSNERVLRGRSCKNLLPWCYNHRKILEKIWHEFVTTFILLTFFCVVNYLYLVVL